MSTIKTIYGEVTYRRAVYEVTEEDGWKHFVYLLEETLELEQIGLLSINMAELLVKGITEQSYRACVAQVSEATGQSISAMGVWNVIQTLGERPEKEKNIPKANPVKPPVLGETEPQAKDELSIRCESERSGNVFAVVYLFLTGVRCKSCMKKVANVYLTVTFLYFPMNLMETAPLLCYNRLVLLCLFISRCRVFCRPVDAYKINDRRTKWAERIQSTERTKFRFWKDWKL